jgi:hypothetical protein
MPSSRLGQDNLSNILNRSRPLASDQFGSPVVLDLTHRSNLYPGIPACLNPTVSTEGHSNWGSRPRFWHHRITMDKVSFDSTEPPGALFTPAKLGWNLFQSWNTGRKPKNGESLMDSVARPRAPFSQIYVDCHRIVL